MTLLQWLTAAASMIGVVLNIKRRRESFAIWFFTNSTWTAIDAYYGIWGQSALFLTYTVLAVYGWFSWGKK